MELHRTGQAARKAKRVITIKVKHALPVITAREYARSGDATKDPTLMRRRYAIVNGKRASNYALAPVAEV